MSANLPCPSCGADVPVRSAALPYVTCGYCHTLIRRDAVGLTAIGTSAILPFDVSPLQLGSGGHGDGYSFTIVGRVRWGWSDGSWNEWLLDCSDSAVRWLGEAMGSFMVTQERPALLDLPAIRPFCGGGDLTRGTIIDVDGETFEASDIKTATCLGSEGDLPRPTPAGYRLTNVDFRGDRGGAISLQRDNDGPSAWIGRGLTLGDLKPTYLRSIDGWSIPAGLQ